MSDLPPMPCKEPVDGSGVVSWPCDLPVNHDGPHSCVEVPASQRRRDQWLKEHQTATVSVGSPTGTNGMDSWATNLGDGRYAVAEGTLDFFADLYRGMRTLNTLVREAGGGPVMLSLSDIATIIPERMKG